MSNAATWIYSGVWAVLTDLFRVRKDPPDLPPGAGQGVRRFRPADGWLRLLKVQFWIVLLLIDLGLIAVWIAIFMEGSRLAAMLTLPLFLIAIIVPDIIAYIAIHLRYDTTWYVLSDRSMRLRRGVMTITETTITFENVQNVTVRQGPLQRLFGIADLQVETAGGGGGAGPHGQGHAGAHTGLIQGIADAQGVRDLIMDRVRASRTGGLGDERDAGVPRPGPGFSPAHLELLRGVRDAARAMAQAAQRAG